MVLDASLGVDGEVKVTKHWPRKREVTARVWELTSSVAQVHASRRINTRQWGQIDVWQVVIFSFIYCVSKAFICFFGGRFMIILDLADSVIEGKPWGEVQYGE